MGGMSTRNEIKARLGILAEPPAKAMAARPRVKAKFDDDAKLLRQIEMLRRQQQPYRSRIYGMYNRAGELFHALQQSKSDPSLITEAKALSEKARLVWTRLQTLELEEAKYTNYPYADVHNPKGMLQYMIKLGAQLPKFEAEIKENDKRVRALAKKAKVTLPFSKHGRKIRAGIMDRLGAAYGALTASPADPTSPQYKQQLAAARKQAQDAVANYKFMRDKAKARQDAMDRYVTAAIKTINASTNVRDVEHFTEQVQIAVRALVTMQSSVKTPFARPGAKAKMAVAADKRQISLWMDQVQKNLTRAVNEARALPSGSDEKYAYRHLVPALKTIMRGLYSGDHRMVRNGLHDLKTQAMADMGDDWRNWVPREVDEWVAGGGQMKSARPGVAVSFDLWTQIQRDLIEKKAPPPSARAWSAAIAKQVALARELAAGSSASGTHRGQYRQQAESLSLLRTAVQRGDKKYARGIIKNLPTEITKDLPADLIAWAQSKGTASRPGAKAKMGKYATQLGWIASQAQDQVELAKKNIRILAKTMHQDPAQRNSRDLSDMRRLFELADKLGMETEIVTIYERGYFSRPGAKATHEAPAQKPGRKVMAESDPAVSAKIRKLMAEGKPQKQAVAIALDMKRRGEI